MVELQVSELWGYPIKSCRGESLTHAGFDRYGLVGDRRGMVVNEKGEFLTQREFPQMACIVPSVREDGLLHLAAPGMEPLIHYLDHTWWDCLALWRNRRVRIWKDRVVALDQGEEVAEWLSDYLHTVSPRLDGRRFSAPGRSPGR